LPALSVHLCILIFPEMNISLDGGVFGAKPDAKYKFASIFT